MLVFKFALWRSLDEPDDQMIQWCQPQFRDDRRAESTLHSFADLFESCFLRPRGYSLLIIKGGRSNRPLEIVYVDHLTISSILRGEEKKVSGLKVKVDVTWSPSVFISFLIYLWVVLFFIRQSTYFVKRLS